MGQRLETDDLTQDALMWLVSGTPDAYGVNKITGATPIKTGRWETSSDRPSDNESNKKQVTLTVPVDRVIGLGSILWKGKKEDFTGDRAGLMEVVGFSEVPDIRNESVRRTATLTNYHGQLPTQI